MSDSTVSGGSLGKDAFLQLMVTQMKYQDPLQPQDNSQFLAQLAQFTALEQMTNVAQTTQTMATYSQLSFEYQLIGKNVEVDAGQGNTVSGVVSGVQFVNGDPQLVIGDSTYPVSSVTKME